MQLTVGLVLTLLGLSICIAYGLSLSDATTIVSALQRHRNELMPYMSNSYQRLSLAVAVATAW